MREYNEKEEEIKNPENSVEYVILKQYCVSYKKILQTKIQMLEN